MMTQLSDSLVPDTQGNYDWVPIYEELASLLADWEDRQDELIEHLSKLRDEGLPVTPINDQFTEGKIGPFQEIDPFTFFGAFNRGTRDTARIRITSSIAKLLGAHSATPTGFDGIPILNNQRSWFICYAKDRRPEDIPQLWRLFRIAVSSDPLNNPEFESAFNDVIQHRGIATSNLTMALYWIRPQIFLNLDRVNRNHLGITVRRGTLDAARYKQILRDVKLQNPDLPFPELSHAAHLSRLHDSGDDGVIDETGQHWLVGAYWHDAETIDQTSRFIEEGVWENGYEDRLQDQVNEMRPGDRIAIKAARTQQHNLPFDGRGNTVSSLDIKARGTIVSNPKNGRSVEVQWDEDFSPRTWYFYTYRATMWKLRDDPTHRHAPYIAKLIDFIWNDIEQDCEWFASEWWDKGADVLPESCASAYSIDDALNGLFIPRKQVLSIINHLHRKKNIIIQGPPGVGKTFMARRLAWALMGQKDPSRIEMVQFHQSYSYEDFIQGWRPNATGGFTLRDGVFYNFCQDAKGGDTHVFIIDEINRGNLSRIFGELMMLIEADKRGASHGIPLTYSDPDDDGRFYVPENVHIIGLMNTADRSLAMVDYALRRRFTFITLEPQFSSDGFRNHLTSAGASDALVSRIVDRLNELNRTIADDTRNLGEGFQVGHSFFCPTSSDVELDDSWYQEVVQHEIAPLLYEYWFDQPNQASSMVDKLLA